MRAALWATAVFNVGGAFLFAGFAAYFAHWLRSSASR
jgi:hypothetical protein